MLTIGENPEAWLVHRILEKRAAERPEHPMMHWDGRDYSYTAINRAANRIAASLAARGIEPGARIAVMIKNTPAHVFVWFATAKRGVVEVPINTAYRGDILAHIVNSARVTAMVLDAEFVPVVARITGQCPGLATFIIDDGGLEEARRALPGAVLALDELAAGDGADVVRTVEATTVACIMFTSGTTGPSKGVVINNHFELSFAVIFNQIVSLDARDVTYNVLPFFHIAGKFILLGTMLADCRMVLRPRFSVAQFWPDVRAHGATVTVAVGGICHMLYAAPPRPDDADNPLRMIYAVPNPHDVREDFLARFDLQLTEGYGSTEANIVAYTRPEEATPKGAAGRAAPQYEIRIVDEMDREVPPDRSGEIVVRAKHPYILMEGYDGLPEATLAAFRNLWFHSGDRGHIDEAGYLYFHDRMKDAIRRRGENISSFEVERIVNKHPDVAETAAIAVAADVGEDEVKVVVVRNPGATLSEEALLRHCVAEMPYFMVPRFIEFKADLPRTPTQKVRKVELRAEGITAATWDREAADFKVTRDGLTRSP